MQTVIFIFRLYILLALLIVTAIILAVPLIVLAIKKKKTARNIFAALVGEVVLMAGCLGLWLASHTCHPRIYDWNYLGKNIEDIEQKYGEFSKIFVSQNGAGYAEYQTEDIIGRNVEIEYDVFRMDFDSTGKVTNVECHGPIGG